MKYILYLLVFAFFATGLTSCESDNPSSGSTTKELEVTPSKTSLGIYEVFTIKARMTNTPLSDVHVKIDFGDGEDVLTYGAGSERTHAYNKTGTYTITVTAYDAYTELPIATKTISIIVSDVIPSVTLSRDVIDTTLMTNSEGTLGYISFSFTTNAPISKVRYQLGDGYVYTDSTYATTTFSYSYQSPGTYKVIVDAYNDKGNYWASDTMTCIIRLPEVTLDMLTSAYNVGVVIAVDSTSSIYQSFMLYGYLGAGIGISGDSLKKVTWTGNSFNAHYVSTRKDYHFTGTISSDLKGLETMTVSIFDSINYYTVSKYGYILSNLELCGMSNQTVIYRAAYRPLSTFASNLYFEPTGVASDFRRSGDIVYMVNNFINYHPPAPYAYVVFTRK